MLTLDSPRPQSSIHWALAVSALAHLVVLLAPNLTPKPPELRLTRLEATMTPRPAKVEDIAPPAPKAPETAPPAPAKPEKNVRKKQILAMSKSSGAQSSQAKPRWTVAQKQDMNRFLEELATPPKAAPKPAPARQAVAAAEAAGKQPVRQDAETRETVERIPNSPPADPFSLEMYFEGMVKRLNRSAGFVKSDPRHGGARPAAVLIRVNPDGSLNNFSILNGGDQQSEISFVKSVVERSIPFLPFPNDIRKSAQTLTLIICIQPNNQVESGATFSRLSSARSC